MKKYEQRLKDLITVELLKQIMPELNNALEVFNVRVINNNIIFDYSVFEPLGSYDRLTYNTEINIDTFCFKCKDWSLEQGYEYKTLNYTIKNKYNFIHIGKIGKVYTRSFGKETEQESIIKATLWIMEQK